MSLAPKKLLGKCARGITDAVACARVSNYFGNSIIGQTVEVKKKCQFHWLNEV